METKHQNLTFCVLLVHNVQQYTNVNINTAKDYLLIAWHHFFKERGSIFHFLKDREVRAMRTPFSLPSQEIQ